MKAKLIFFGLLLTVFCFYSLSHSGVPQMINYQGKITTPAGALVDTTVQMIFTIYDDSTTGTVLWADTQSAVAVEKGIFSVLLGSVNPIPDSVFPGDVRYLGVKVGADPEMNPRKSIVSVGYAYKAEYADTAEYARAAAGAGDIDWTFRVTDTADTTLITGGEWGIARSGNVLHGNTDSTHVNLGVDCTTGTSGQNYKYCIVAGGLINKATHNYATVGGGYRNTASWSNATVGGGDGSRASGHFSTVAGGHWNEANGWGAFVGGGEANWATQKNSTVGGGEANKATGMHSTVAGGQDDTASATYAFVGGGFQNHASGYAATIPGGHYNKTAGDYSVAAGKSVSLTSDADYTFAFGREFTTSTPNAVIFHNSVDPIKVGIGTTTPIAGSALHVQNNNLYAGYFTSNYLSEETHVIHAEFTGSGDSYPVAVYGKSRPLDGRGYGGDFEGGYMGVAGRVSATGSESYYGVFGKVVGSGEAGNHYGVYGYASGMISSYGVYGYASGGINNYAGYFQGNAKVTGLLTKGAGSFQIDHPLDPENKYLFHSFVESPDMKNVYDGVITLDASGQATVELPAYFEALNRDFRYQLTAIGAPGPNLYIAAKIADNQFSIAGGEPGMQVSWQVTGIRHDKFAEANRIQVEVDKPDNERGKYLHPEAYKLGEEYDIHYEQNKRMKEKEEQRKLD